MLVPLAVFGGAEGVRAHYYLGGLYWELRQYKRAADGLETYLRLTPAAPDADRARDHQGTAQQTVARPPQPLPRGLTLPPAVHLPATTFKKIHKTLEAMQDFAESIFLEIGRAFKKNNKTLKAIQDFGGKIFLGVQPSK